MFVTLKLSWKVFLKDVKVKVSSKRGFMFQKNAFTEVFHTFNTFVGYLQKLLFCNSCKLKNCSVNVALIVFDVMSIMTQSAKLISISYKTNFWWVKCLSKGKIFVPCLFSAQLFFSVASSKVGQLLSWEQNRN